MTVRQVDRPRSEAIEKVVLDPQGTDPQIVLVPQSAAPTTGLEEGAVYWNSAANGASQYDGTAFHQLSDRHIITYPIDANSVDCNIFIADRAYQILSFEGTKSAAGGTSAAVGLKKCTGTTAPGSGTAVTTADLDLTSTVAVNTVQPGSLSGTAANLLLADGDRLALDFSGTLTSLKGIVTVVLQQV